MSNVFDTRPGAPAPWRPGYLGLAETGELSRRVERLRTLLEPCRLCPRGCGAERLSDRIGACFSGRRAQVASWCDHHGEEPPLSGTRGSGTVFFANCNLRCVYCQNHQISQRFRRFSEADPTGRAGEGELTAESLAAVLLALQARGCHNINFVSPTHFAPQMAEAVALAAARGLRLPIVYNTNAYDSPEALRLLEGIVDVWLPDLKYGDAETGRRYSRVRDYPAHARAAIVEMWRQGGALRLGEDGTARRGVIVRHLVLPNDLADSEASLRWLREAAPGATLSLMAQYFPAHHALRHPLLARRATAREYARVIDLAVGLGFREILAQNPADAPDHYRPDFEHEHPFHTA
ncbi:MAG: radical SAM protein [bacterium]|nr:radical SAM protein [bacterium]